MGNNFGPSAPNPVADNQDATDAATDSARSQWGDVQPPQKPKHEPEKVR